MLVTGTQDILYVGFCIYSPGFGTSKATHGFFYPARSPGVSIFCLKSMRSHCPLQSQSETTAIRKKPLTPFGYHQAGQLYMGSLVQKHQTAKWLCCFLVSGPQAVSYQCVRIWQVLLECSRSRIPQAQDSAGTEFHRHRHSFHRKLKLSPCYKQKQRKLCYQPRAASIFGTCRHWEFKQGGDLVFWIDSCISRTLYPKTLSVSPSGLKWFWGALSRRKAGGNAFTIIIYLPLKRLLLFCTREEKIKLHDNWPKGCQKKSILSKEMIYSALKINISEVITCASKTIDLSLITMNYHGLNRGCSWDICV